MVYFLPANCFVTFCTCYFTGLDEEVVKAISKKKDEPEWMLEFRLRAFRKWLTMTEPEWSDNTHPKIDYQAYSYYSAPKEKEKK